LSINRYKTIEYEEIEPPTNEILGDIEKLSDSISKNLKKLKRDL